MDTNELRELTAEIVSAYVSNNPVARTDLPDIVKSVFEALGNVGAPQEPEAPALVPPVSVKKSITPDHLISMEDGKPYKSLKRHLNVRGLTPAEYRQKWNLPADYPMTAANYSAARSALAKKLGLGRKAEPEPVAKPKRAPKAK